LQFCLQWIFSDFGNFVAHESQLLLFCGVFSPLGDQTKRTVKIEDFFGESFAEICQI
jgi:hypothetical protein